MGAGLATVVEIGVGEATGAGGVETGGGGEKGGGGGEAT